MYNIHNFESGGGVHNASEVSMSARIPRGRGILPPTDNFLWMVLPALALGVLLDVCCYFGNLGNALMCESYYFSTTNYRLDQKVYGIDVTDNSSLENVNESLTSYWL